MEDCVNSVGVDVNTASPALLVKRSPVLRRLTAKNIVSYRDENGVFTARKQLLKVQKAGAEGESNSALVFARPEKQEYIGQYGCPSRGKLWWTPKAPDNGVALHWRMCKRQHCRASGRLKRVWRGAGSGILRHWRVLTLPGRGKRTVKTRQRPAR